MIDEEGRVFGKWPAYVVKNSELIPDIFEFQPYEGCIKVICPELFGWSSPPTDGLPFVVLKEYMNESSWIRPCWQHPMDFYIPEEGEGVFIECISGRGLDTGLYYTGFYPGEDFVNYWSLQPSAGLNPAYENVTDRMIGSRQGSYLKFDDGLIGQGLTTLEAGGPNILNPIQAGPKVILDPFPALESAELIATDKLGVFENAVRLSMLAGGEVLIEHQLGSSIIISPTGITIEDISGNSIELSPFGIDIWDVLGNSIIMEAQGIEILDITGNTITLDSLGGNITLEDISTLNKIVIGPTGLSLITIDSLLWKPNALPNCIFSGVPHGGPPLINFLKGT